MKVIFKALFQAYSVQLKTSDIKLAVRNKRQSWTLAFILYYINLQNFGRCVKPKELSTALVLILIRTLVLLRCKGFAITSPPTAAFLERV